MDMTAITQLYFQYIHNIKTTRFGQCWLHQQWWLYCIILYIVLFSPVIVSNLMMARNIIGRNT